MSATTCDAKGFADFLVAGTYFLRKYRSTVNGLNVFPVPDGDTGTNMFLTARSAMLEVSRRRGANVGKAAAAAAQGSLMGARGNSGVILSQMLRGFAQALDGKHSIDTIEMAAAMQNAVQAARRSLLNPVEGTILSVGSAAADAAQEHSAGERRFAPLLEMVVAAANEALQRTPQQLAVLADAQVVDAGGQGLLYFLEGVLRMTSPHRAACVTVFPNDSVRSSAFTEGYRVEQNQYCTEFVLLGARIDAERLQRQLEKHGDSLIVAGEGETLRVHLHTDFPEKVQVLVEDFGTLSKLKVENMQDQHRHLLASGPSKERGIVAVAPGEGFAKICRQLGADVTVRGGATMNPSVKELLAAVNSVPAGCVYLLPNDKNVVLAANEVASLTDRSVVVAPTQSIVDGIATLIFLSGNAGESVADRVRRAEFDSGLLASGSIFRAGKNAEIAGVAAVAGQLTGAIDARHGQPQRLIEGRNAREIAAAFVRSASSENASLLTLYYGSRCSHGDAQALAAALTEEFKDLSVEVYYGGQGASDYVMSIER